MNFLKDLDKELISDETLIDICNILADKDWNKIKGIEVLFKYNQISNLVYYHLVKNNNFKLFKKFLEANNNPSFHSRFGLTELMLEVIFSDKVSNLEKINDKDILGLTALHFAYWRRKSEKNGKEIINLLEDIALVSKDKFGRYPDGIKLEGKTIEAE